MYNVGGTGERREECTLSEVHFLSNVLYNLKNSEENTVNG